MSLLPRSILGAALAAPFLLSAWIWPDPMASRWLLAYIATAVAFGFSLRQPWRLDSVDFAAAMLMAWLVLSLFWSADSLAGAQRAWNIGAMLLLFLSLRRLSVPDILPWLPFGILAVWAALELAGWRGMHGGYGNANFLAETLWLLLPLMALRDGWTRAGAVLVLIWLLFDDNRAEAVIALTLGLGMIVWLAKNRERMAAATCLAWLWVAIGSLWLWTETGRTIVTGRLEIWLGTLKAWAEAPLIGHGLGSFNHVFDSGANMSFGVDWTIMPLDAHFTGAAHNEYLETLLEIGVVGYVLAALLIVLVVHRLSTPGRCVAIVGAALAMAYFPFHHPTSAMVLAIVAAAQNRVYSETWLRARWCRRAAAAVACLFLGAVIVMGARWNMAQADYMATRAFLKDQPAMALMANVSAWRRYSFDPAVRLQLFRTYARAMLDVGASPETADALYAVSRSAMPRNPGLLLARHNYLRLTDRNPEERLAIRRQLMDGHGRRIEQIVKYFHAVDTGDFSHL